MLEVSLPQLNGGGQEGTNQKTLWSKKSLVQLAHASGLEDHLPS